MFFYIFVHLLLNDYSEPDCQCPHQPQQRSQQEHKLIIFSVATFLEAITTRVGPDIRFGRIPDIKTIQMADILLIYNAGYPVIRPDIRTDNRISGNKNRPKKYPAQP